MTTYYRLGETVDGADFFCGGGGASDGLEGAGVELRFAANHDAIAIATHAANHPEVDHHHVDLLEYDVGKFPAVRMAHFSPSCKHHSQANAHKVYEEPAVLRDYIAGHDGDEEARSGYANSERSRVTMSCVLRYAAVRRPETMIVENVVEAAKWGPGRDGTTFAWWLRELDHIGYETRPMFLNSMAFGVPQSRDRMFVVCWLKGMRAPNLDHWSSGWCPNCEAHVDAFQFFRKPTKAWPLPEWGKLGKQYDYRCGRCTEIVALHTTPVATVLDFSDLGTKISERDKPLADSTIGRIERYLSMHEHRLPMVTITASANHGGAGWSVEGPMGAITTRHEQAIVQAGAQVVVYGNTHEREGSTCRGRSLAEPTWAQHTTEAYGLAFHAAVGTSNGGWGGRTFHDATTTPSPTVVTTQRPQLMAWAQGVIPFRRHTIPTSSTEPAPTFTAENRGHGLATFFRMFKIDEIRGAMSYRKDFRFARPDGAEPSKRDKIRLLGDGVTPPVLTWLTNRTLEVMA